jgi:predicted GIY-YIG superfamily endonuclease
VYVLKLEHNKFYVGWSERGYQERVQEHFDGIGSAWTQEHPPIMLMQW